MSVSSNRFGSLSRRDVLKVAAAGVLAGVLTPVMPSLADEAEEVLYRVTDDTTIGDVLRALEPEHWAQIHPDVQAVLNEAPMDLEASGPQARVGGYVTLKASDGILSSQYYGSYKANEVCPMVACLVTYSKNGNIVASSDTMTNEYDVWVSVSGQFQLSPGTYRAVITGYPMQPPPGGTIEYAQTSRTVTVHS